MKCGCEGNQSSRSGTASPVLALGVLMAPVMGAVLYMSVARDSHATDSRVAKSIAAPDSDGAVGAGWSRLTVSTLEGSDFALAELAPKPVILYFWATWCPLCKVQREVLHVLSGEWGDRVQIVALTADDDVPPVKRYLETHASLTHELRANTELLRLFRVDGLPTLAVIDAAGNVRNVSSGLSDASELRRIVVPLLP